jgi:SAM-dependent methyltransferase
LEKALAENMEYAFVRGKGGSLQEIQHVLDMIATDICGSVGADALAEHVRVVYEETAGAYASNLEHANIFDALLTFMGYLPNDAKVLDLGCGSGRDAVFMALKDAEKRKAFMLRVKDGKTTLERFGVPQKSFRVIGVDPSLQMVVHAKRLATAYGFAVHHEEHPCLLFLPGVDLYYIRSGAHRFDGIWSSAALFMHMPKGFVGSSLVSAHAILKPKGILGVSYANNSAGLPYDNLRYSRTGGIKYFSRPTPTAIVVAAEASGFLLREELLTDLEIAGEVKKNFFITQIFQKT